MTRNEQTMIDILTACEGGESITVTLENGRTITGKIDVDPADQIAPWINLGGWSIPVSRIVAVHWDEPYRPGPLG